MLLLQQIAMNEMITVFVITKKERKLLKKCLKVVFASNPQISLYEILFFE